MTAKVRCIIEIAQRFASSRVTEDEGKSAYRIGKGCNNNNLDFVLEVHKVHDNSEHRQEKYCACRSIGPTEKKEEE